MQLNEAGPKTYCAGYAQYGTGIVIIAQGNSPEEFERNLKKKTQKGLRSVKSENMVVAQHLSQFHAQLFCEYLRLRKPTLLQNPLTDDETHRALNSPRL